MISLCKQLGKQTPQIFFDPPTYLYSPQTTSQQNCITDNQVNDLFSSGNKSYSLSSTRSKGLTLSVKKIQFYRQPQQRKPQSKNSQQMILLQNRGLCSKDMQYSKSVHNLKGRNINFLKSNNKTSSIRNSLGNKIAKIQRVNPQVQQEILRKVAVFQKDQYNLLISKKLQNSQESFNIRVFQVDRNNNEKKWSVFQQPTLKPSSLIKRSFLRSKSKQNNADNLVNKFKNDQQISFCGNSKSRQQKAKKQFLQSYIKKPMINSIIMTTPSQQLRRKSQKQRQRQIQIQSPILKLKQRLQINRINNIFEKETIISKEGIQSCASVRIQESMIIQKRIRQNFIVVSNKLNVFQEGYEHPYKMYLVKEKHLNLLVSIKQCPLQHISSISQQILIYRELSQSKQQFANILNLHQFSLDLDRYLLIKQPYTESLCEYLQECINEMRRDFDMQYEAKIKSILKSIQKTLIELSHLGIRLRRLVDLQDIALIFQSIKIHNMSIFKISNKDDIQIHRAVANLEEQIMIHLNKISKGSVATSHE